MIDMVLLTVALIASMTVVWYLVEAYETVKRRNIHKRDSYPKHKG